MDGAGAGIGGNGGKGGNASSNTWGASIPMKYGLGSSGFCGENGENCGIVNINENIVIYSYGGAGGSASKSGDNNSGSGAGGYPAAGIGRWTVLGRSVGGEHACSGGRIYNRI